MNNVDEVLAGKGDTRWPPMYTDTAKLLLRLSVT